MALTYNGTSGPTRGIETAETGIVCASFSCRYFPYVNDYLEGITGEPVTRAVSSKLSREVSVSGEVAGSTGIMAITVATAATVANDVSTFGDGTGAFYFQEATESQERGGWRSVDVQLLSHPLIAS